MPKELNINPRYEQKSFKPADRANQIFTVVAPDNQDAVWINQDAWFSLANFKAGKNDEYFLRQMDNGVYVFVINGSVTINDTVLHERDGLGIWDIGSIKIEANTNTELLLIEVPMNINEA